ncbi:MAG: glycosyltransferase [Thermodesulfobacteriota bacterium]|nr:glycosyltransferase [Thermodesulfobacteriota bacterium]
MMKPLIFIPTYNEAGNVHQLVAEISALGLDLDILFIDDGSPDGTGDILDDLAGKMKNLKVIHRSGRSGVGSAHLTAVHYAWKNGYERLVTMDGDLTHSPGDIPRLLAKGGEYDVVIASRFAGSRSSDMQGLGRRLLSRIGHMATRWVLGLPYDASSAFRLYALKQIPPGVLASICTTGYAFFFESLFLLARNRARIGEVPVSILPRQGGDSKMSMVEAARWLKRLMSIRMQNR